MRGYMRESYLGSQPAHVLRLVQVDLVDGGGSAHSEVGELQHVSREQAVPRGDVAVDAVFRVPRPRAINPGGRSGVDLHVLQPVGCLTHEVDALVDRDRHLVVGAQCVFEASVLNAVR